MPVLKVYKVLPYCSEAVAAGNNDLNYYLRLAMPRARVARMIGGPSRLRAHRPGSEAALESMDRSWWDPYSRDLRLPDEDDGISGCAQL